MGGGIERDQLGRLGERVRRTGGVQFHAPNPTGLGAAPVKIETPVVVGEHHRINERRYAAGTGNLDAPDSFKRAEGRLRRVKGRFGGQQQEAPAMFHHGGRVADVADVQRLMLPRRAVVRADPGHVHRRVEVPFAVQPQRRGVGQLAEWLLVIQQPDARTVGRGAVGDVPRRPAEGVIRNGQRVAEGRRRRGCGPRGREAGGQQGGEKPGFHGRNRYSVLGESGRDRRRVARG